MRMVKSVILRNDTHMYYVEGGVAILMHNQKDQNKAPAKNLYEQLFFIDENDLDEYMGQSNNLKKDYQRIRRRDCFALSLTGLLLGVTFIASFCVGRYGVSLENVATSIYKGVQYVLWLLGNAFGWHQPQPALLDSSEDIVVWLVRMPRILAAILVGGSLAFSGATYQGLFRNPMVSPDILGAAAGASVGACIMMLFHQNNAMIQGGAFVVGILAVIFSYFLSKVISRGSNATLILVLCGMTVNALFQSFVSIIKYLADPESQLPEMTYWLMGSIAKVDYEDLKYFFVTFVIGTAPVLLLRWRLNILSMGEDEAKSMGVNISRTRLICIICATLLTASVVSFAGTIGWVGLMIPHLARFIVGPNNKVLLPMSLLAGSLFMLIIDNICRTLLPYEIPLGVLTSLLGAPFFIYILYKKKGGE